MTAKKIDHSRTLEVKPRRLDVKTGKKNKQLGKAAAVRGVKGKILAINYTKGLDAIWNKSMDRLTPEKHETRTDAISIDMSKIRLTDTREKGEPCVGGEKNLKRLLARKGEVQLDAYVLLALYQRPELIPKEWENYSRIFFWGTIFRGEGGHYRYVAYLYRLGDTWCYHYRSFNTYWFPDEPAASLASSP